MASTELIPKGFVLESDEVFNKAIDLTSGFEGGFTVDSGGPTNYGITQTALNNYQEKKGLSNVDVKKISPDYARKIAKEEYFDRPNFSVLPENTAIVMFDYGFNAGPQKAAKTLQRIVGATPDGQIGPKTIKATQSYIEKNGEESLLKGILDSREKELTNLIENNPKKYAPYKNGWMNRLNSIRKQFDISSLNQFSTKEAFADEFVNTLPEGFQLEKPSAGEVPTNLPEGFQLEKSTPILERLGKGYGMGVAGTVEATGGLLKWFGAEKVGKAFTDYANEMKQFYSVPDPKFIDQIAAGFGSFSTFFLPGLGIAKGAQALQAVPKLAMLLGATSSATLEAMVEAGSTYERSRNKGMDDEGASSAATFDFILNLPSSVVLNNLGVFSHAGKPLLKALKSAAGEGSQEFLQQVVSNVAASDPALEGALASLFVGAITGGVTMGVISTAQDLDTLRQAKILKDKIKDLSPKDNLARDASGKPIEINPMPSVQPATPEEATQQQILTETIKSDVKAVELQISNESNVKFIIEKAGGKFKAITDMNNSLFEDEPTIYYDTPSGNTQTIRPSQLNFETVQKKIQDFENKFVQRPKPNIEVVKTPLEKAGQEFSYKEFKELNLAEPAKTPQDFSKRIDQLNKFAQARAILRKSGKMKGKSGVFKSIPKEGEVGLAHETMYSPKQYMETLGHELGHSIEFNVLGKTNQGLKLFGEKLDVETLKSVRKELIAVTKDLVGEETMNSKPGYYYRPAELIARYFEKMIGSPGNLEELAPTVSRLIKEKSLKHPIIQEFLEAANEGIDKGAPKFVLLRDLKQTYQKFLGKRVGDIAYGEEVAYRAMKERAKFQIEKFINEKFKGVKDSPEALFKTAESIKISRSGQPEFGTRDFAIAKTQEEEAKLLEMGYTKIPLPVTEDGKAYAQFAKWRYTPEQAKQIFDSLSPAGKKLVLDFTAERSEAKDYFNREVIREVNKIEASIEGWVHHYFEETPGGSTIVGGKKFRKKIAGTRKHREGALGYVEDFQKAMTKVLIDLEGEKVYNDFIKRQFARVTRPLAEGEDPMPGWIEVVGTLKTGVGLPFEKRTTIIDKESGKTIPAKQARYQMPKPIYERYKLWRGLVDEATTAVRVVNDINRYWRINILTHPGLPITNFISGGIQYSSKILTDFYKEILTGDLSMSQTKRNISAMAKVLLPKGWMSAPDWVYGGDLSNFYGQFMKQPSALGGAIDEYGNKALKLYGLIERYWKKVILLADNVSDIDSLNKMTPEGLKLPTEEERNLIASINEDVDLYAYDYDNVSLWLEAHQKSVMGQAIKPFAKYPYKYAKQVLDMIGSAFDQTQSWQDRTAKILALTTMVAAYAAFSKKRKEEQKTPMADVNLEIPARLQTRGRLFITTDDEGRELFMRVAKYPFINLTESGMQFIDGNWESGKDAISDMLGSVGPAAQIGLLALNFRNKYNTYDSVPVILGENLATFIPGYRILNDVSRMLDPFQRKQETFGQAVFFKLIPTTDSDLQRELHGNIREERIPIEGEIEGPVIRRTTIEKELENYWQDILLSMLSGVYVSRIDPKIVEAFIIRKEKNLEKRQAKELRE